MLVLAIAEDFHELLENRGPTAVASLGELGGVMIVAKDLAFVFIVAVLSAEYRWADGTGEMLDVVFFV